MASKAECWPKWKQKASLGRPARLLLPVGSNARPLPHLPTRGWMVIRGTTSRMGRLPLHTNCTVHPSLLRGKFGRARLSSRWTTLLLLGFNSIDPGSRGRCTRCQHALERSSGRLNTRSQLSGHSSCNQSPHHVAPRSHEPLHLSCATRHPAHPGGFNDASG